MNSGVYKIVNKVNGKFYVGSASYLDKRWSKHRIDLSNNKHHSAKLQAAWNKYGANNFIFEVIEIAPKEKILSIEQYWIDTAKPQYNMLLVAGSPIGCKRSAETIAKMSIRMTGSTRSLESRAKQSLSRIGMKLSEEHKANIGIALVGKKRSEEARANMSAAQKRKDPMSDEQKKKLSDYNKGKVLSATTREKIAASMKKLRAAQRLAKENYVR